MSARLSVKISDSQCGVFAQPTRDCANPTGRLTLRLPACTPEEPLDRSARASFGRVVASLCEAAHLCAGSTSNPLRHRYGWKRLTPEPGGIELNLDLLESKRRNRVSMSCAAAIENRRWTGDELLPGFSLVQI
jgi:hypothetical protein